MSQWLAEGSSKLVKIEAGFVAEIGELKDNHTYRLYKLHASVLMVGFKPSASRQWC